MAVKINVFECLPESKIDRHSLNVLKVVRIFSRRTESGCYVKTEMIRYVEVVHVHVMK